MYLSLLSACRVLNQGRRRAKERAVGYILSAQRKDGSWCTCNRLLCPRRRTNFNADTVGSWGICFTYAGMFALESLASVGKDYSNSAEVRRGIDFFVERRMEDGGWGESFRVSTLFPPLETAYV